MLIYSLNCIPDLTLSKYQVFADIGVDGVLTAQTMFLKQLHRISLLGKINIHFLYCYDPKLGDGDKMRIYLIFNETEELYREEIRNLIRASAISEYFQMTECEGLQMSEYRFKYSSVISKKERFLQTTIGGTETHFYVVSGWKMSESARLYNFFKLMASFNAPCCYRVDLYTRANMDEDIHKSFERPLTFLRNISNNEKGLSDLSRNFREKRDPNADETLRQYEDWLKAIDTSPLFRCRITTFADNKMYSQMLLDTVLAESVESGNGTIYVDEGSYSIKSDIDETPDRFCSNGTPNSLKEWSTTFTSEEIAPFCRLPVLYDGETIEIPKETAAVHENEGIVLGKDTNSYKVCIPRELLPKHMFVCGVPGSGKTNTMLHLANSLWNHSVTDNKGNVHQARIPFLVLEPAKREYRELALFNIPELLIFSPSACTDFPIKINPFEFPKKLTLSEHISKLCQVFEGAFPIAPPAPFILDRAIQAVYEKHGWKTSDINLGTKGYPVMSELYEQFEIEMDKTNYDGEVRGNIRSVLEMRIGSLLRREMKDIFDVPKSTLSPEEWLENPIIIELEALGEGPANFVTLLLCTLIRETLKANPNKDKDMPVRHVIFIEEAHNLIGPEAQVQNGQDSNPKIAATAFIVKMLAEVRALREGIIIADQLPTAMAPEVIKNTNIKLVHRLTSMDDRQLVGSTMSASALQIENMASYKSGQALFAYEKLLRPFEMRVSLVEEHGEKTPSDSELYELMIKKPTFFALYKGEEEAKWETLKTKIMELSEKEVKLIGIFKDADYDKGGVEKFQKIMETAANVIGCINLMKKRYIYECMLISERFIDKDRKDALCGIVQKIGLSCEEAMDKFILNY